MHHPFFCFCFLYYTATKELKKSEFKIAKKKKGLKEEKQNFLFDLHFFCTLQKEFKLNFFGFFFFFCDRDFSFHICRKIFDFFFFRARVSC